MRGINVFIYRCLSSFVQGPNINIFTKLPKKDISQTTKHGFAKTMAQVLPASTRFDYERSIFHSYQAPQLFHSFLYSEIDRQNKQLPMDNW